jgi:hypothetical protein
VRMANAPSGDSSGENWSSKLENRVRLPIFRHHSKMIKAMMRRDEQALLRCFFARSRW